MAQTASSSVSLPVVEANGKKIKQTRIGPWRAAALVALHVFMAIHIVQWLVMGSTISPIEPSESMETLEQGFINAGAIFFAAAIILTVVFGRYICGWACHVVALQDFCHWLMGKAGIRPKPFRSRLLIFIPLALGFYMFIWPTFKRVALEPALASMGMGWPWWLRKSPPLFGVQSEIVVTDFWATFPEWYIAVPFLLVCGFATVYFLGAKAFCTYACPYGGIFAFVEPVAPVRIRVDHDKCQECGHCTAACTSNVRVHEEIKAYGMVVDPGCMKTMDCISVCPNDALSIGLGRPALGAGVRDEAKDSHKQARAKRRYDLNWPGEVAALLVFVFLFIATRGMFDRVPMLMAGGLAIVGTGLTVLLWKMLFTPNARIHRLTLKSKGAIRPLGYAFALLMLAGWAFAAWGGVGNVTRWRGDALHAGVGVPVDTIMRPEYAPSATTVQRARAGLEWFARADSFENGGIGWELSPDDLVRVAYLHTVLGQNDRAVETLRKVIETGNPTDALVFQLLAVHAADANARAVGPDRADMIGRANDEQLEIMRDAIALHPELHGVRLRLSQQLFNMALFDWSVWDVEDEAIAEDPKFLLNKGQVHALHSERDKMGDLLDRVIAMETDRPEILLEAAQLAGSLGRSTDAQRLLKAALEHADSAPALMSAARITASTGRIADARALVDRALEAHGGRRPAARFDAGRFYLSSGQTDKGREMMISAADDFADEPWQLLGVASALVQTGMEPPDQALKDAGIELLRGLVEDHPDTPTFRHDLAGWLFSTGSTDEAVEQIVRAAELGASNAVLAQRAAQLLQAAGQQEQAQFWMEQARLRAENP